MTLLHWFFLIAILFAAFHTIEGAIEFNIFKAGICFVVTIITAITALGYDGYVNSGVWFG
jgi:hypothetical protein